MRHNTEPVSWPAWEATWPMASLKTSIPGLREWVFTVA